MSIFFSEYYIRKYLLVAMEEIKDDPIGFADLIFGDILPLGQFNIKNEFKNLFSTDTPFKIKFGLNVASENLPAVHIYLPGETLNPVVLGSDPEFDLDEDIETKVNEENTFRFNTKYNLMIVDKNADSVIIFYHTIKYMLLRYSHLFEIDGFINLKIYGNDLITEQNLIPMTIFSRSITLDFDYEFISRNAYYYSVGTSLKVDPKIEMIIKKINGV